MAKYKILRRTKYRADASGKNADVRLDLDLSRFEGQYQKAQYALDSAIMHSMVPMMPRQTGTFINLTRGASAAMAGSGRVVAAVGPMGRYLYYGKVMVNSVTGKGPGLVEISPGEFAPRWRKGTKLVPTERPLKYASASAVPEWFEEAKKRHRSEWIRIVKEKAGGGTRG